MSEYHCPHCGEPVDENAQACPHCDSDQETGWKGDVDYYSVELPDDDDDWRGDGDGVKGHAWSSPDNAARSGRRGRIGSILLLTAALPLFMIVGYRAYGWAVLVPTLALLGAFAFSAVRASERRE